MANRAIALQARAPQGNFLAPALQQGAQFINMMSQQRAAERQAAVQQQQLDIARTRESREAAKAPFELTAAKEAALTAEQKTVLGFYDLTTEGLKRASTPEQAMVVANYLKEKFPGAASAVDQTISTLPSDPGQFEAWRRQTLFQSMSAKEQLGKKFIEQNTGTGTRQLEVSEYQPGAVAQELPGSRIDTGQEITYVKGADGEVIPMPKRMAPAGGGLVGGARGGGVTPVATALQTNPGAIRDGGFARSQPGYAGASGGFATFDTPQAGVAAQENLLRGSYVAKGFNTINKIIDRYSPAGGENAPAAVANYKAYVARRAGIDANAPITAAQVPGVAAAMREFETGQRPTGAPAAAPAAGGGIQFGVPIPGTSKPPKPKAGEISPEKKLARDRAVQDLYDAVVDAQKKGHLVSEKQSYMANRAQELRQGRAYLPGGTEQKSSVDTIEAIAAQLLRQLIEKGTSGTLNALGEQKLFLRSVGGADSTYETRLKTIRNFAKQNGVALDDYADDAPSAAPIGPPPPGVPAAEWKAMSPEDRKLWSR